MKSKKHQLSQEKYDELAAELKYLSTTRKKELNRAWRLAVEEGDDRETDAITVTVKLLEDNMLEMIRLKEILLNSEIVERTPQNETATIGSHVQIRIDGREQLVILTDTVEADPALNKFSVESPLGSAVTGSRSGEKKKFITPNGQEKLIEILSVS